MRNVKYRYILICILFICLLIFSNKIIVLFMDNNFTKATDSIENYIKNNVYFCIDELRCHEDIFGSFNFIGWVFCETVLDNSNKEVWAILNNGKDTYKIKLELNKRKDVSEKYIDDYNIKGIYHGFSETLSTVDVKSGVYKLYIYCKENDENYGLVDTGLMLKKDGKGISKYTWQSTLSRISSPVEDLQAKSSLDSANITAEGYLQIVGWSFVDGFDTTNQSVYIRLSNEDGTTATYNTQSVSRPDVGKAYKNDIYNESGFKAVIPIDMLPAGDIKIEILVENDGNIYKAQKLYIYSPDP